MMTLNTMRTTLAFVIAVTSAKQVLGLGACAQVGCNPGWTLTGADSAGCFGYCVVDGGEHTCHSYQSDYVVGKSYTKSLESLGVEQCAQKCFDASQCVAFTFKTHVVDQWGNPGRNSSRRK